MNTNNAEIVVNQLCKWDGGYDYEDPYTTACGHTFTLDEGTAEDNNFKFCPFCGKTIVDVTDYEEDEDGESED